MFSPSLGILLFTEKSALVHRHATGRYGEDSGTPFLYAPLIHPSDIDSNVQSTHNTFTKRNLRRHTLQEPYRLLVEDIEN